MTPLRRKLLVASLATPILLYTAYCTTLALVQRSIVFEAQPARDSLPANPIWIEADEAKVELRWYPTQDSSGIAGIFFHGNKEIVNDWPLSIEDWNRRGVSVLLMEFPGYGHSTGKGSSQERLRAVSAATYDWLARQPGVRPERIFAAGRSLGGGLACDLSTVRPVGGLFLQSTFRSIRDRGVRLYKVPGFIILDPFDNTEALRSYKGPILAMHGTVDAKVPFEDLAALQEAAPHMRKVVFPGYHHSDIPGKDTLLYWSGIDSFLNEVRTSSTHR
jgi:hypothetical protein